MVLTKKALDDLLHHHGFNRLFRLQWSSRMWRKSMREANIRVSIGSFTFSGPHLLSFLGRLPNDCVSIGSFAFSGPHVRNRVALQMVEAAFQ